MPRTPYAHCAPELPRLRTILLSFGLSCVFASGGVVAQGLPQSAPGASLGRTRTTVERLSIDRLRAVHRDVQRLQARRRELPSPRGVLDLRAVFHAHAGDSDHTGGAPDELLAEAKRAGVRVVFLSDHHRPPRDFMDSWRGLRDGVLFVPGSEWRGFLLHPESSIEGSMDAPESDLLAAAGAGLGIVFLSHLEERTDHALEGVHGIEIYNRHADALDDGESMRALLGWMTDPDGAMHLRRALELYPREVFASQWDYPTLYLAKWDRDAQHRHVVGVAAADCHHNQVLLVKKVDSATARVGTVVDSDEEMRVVTIAQRPRLAELLRPHAPGEVVARFDFDPYHVALLDSSTHILAPALTESAIREAVLAGRIYVSHDWIADPTGFRFVAHAERRAQVFTMGDQVPFEAKIRLEAELPLEAELRLLRDGEEVATKRGDRWTYDVKQPGVYRLEAWLEIAGERRVWIYSNPIWIQRHADEP
ncbi:MAG TPA: histidinol phosphatase [Thermoanaerobaculia bacterium]|nr:histidinol phosphatase [Thermoanaerobaculia bacterium]